MLKWRWCMKNLWWHLNRTTITHGSCSILFLTWFIRENFTWRPQLSHFFYLYSPISIRVIRVNRTQRLWDSALRFWHQHTNMEDLWTSSTGKVAGCARARPCTWAALTMCLFLPLLHGCPPHPSSLWWITVALGCNFLWGPHQRASLSTSETTTFR